MSFELNQLALEDQAALHLTHPATDMPLYADKEETKPVQIILKGQASQTYARAVDAMMKAAAKRGKREATPAEAREQSVNFLVALSVTAENLTLDGEPVDSQEAFRKLYSDERFGWIKTQVNEFLGKTEAFLK
jgi:hypothetical protein